MFEVTDRNTIIFSFIVIVLLGSGLVFGAYKYSSLKDTFEKEKSGLEEEVLELMTKTEGLEESLAKEKERNKNILDALRSEENKNRKFSEVIEEITGTVGDLERLSETDPELLKKYSRVFFLNEHYTPRKLSQIPAEYTHNHDKEYLIHGDVLPYLEDLLSEAEEDGVNLRVISAFRSFGEQSSLKSGYDIVYGEGTANEFSASQGYSEHQLGTTVDFTTEELGAFFENFDKTDAYKWLLSNAHDFGFVLSYPEDNSFYVFEPWHWRFVGTKLARDIDRRDTGFYEMSQREIDQYLIDLFE